MCEIEDLTLYAETEKNYKKILNQCHFKSIEMRDENHHYLQYNQDIVIKLNTKEMADIYKPSYAGISLQQTINCYQLIADSIKDNELLIRWIKCRK